MSTRSRTSYLLFAKGIREPVSDRGLDIACMASVWLRSVGFAVAFVFQDMATQYGMFLLETNRSFFVLIHGIFPPSPSLFFSTF